MRYNLSTYVTGKGDYLFMKLLEKIRVSDLKRQKGKNLSPSFSFEQGIYLSERPFTQETSAAHPASLGHTFVPQATLHVGNAFLV